MLLKVVMWHANCISYELRRIEEVSPQRHDLGCLRGHDMILYTWVRVCEEVVLVTHYLMIPGHQEPWSPGTLIDVPFRFLYIKLSACQHYKPDANHSHTQRTFG